MVRGPMRYVRERSVEFLVGGLLLAVALTVTAGTASVLVAMMTLVGTLSVTPGFVTMLVLLAAVLGFGASSLVLAIGIAWTVLDWVRNVVATAHRRSLWKLYRRARAFEEGTLPGQFLQPAGFFEREGPGEGPLVEELKARYVAGEFDDREFERELGRLFGGGTRVGRELRREIDIEREPAVERERVAEPDLE